MNFTPKSEKEVSRLFEKGNYSFEVVQAEEKTSSSGNQMMHLILKIYDGNRSSLVHDYLLTDNPNFEFKLRHFCYSARIGEQYEKGTITPDMIIGRSGTAVVSIEVDKSGQYPDKNKVVDYKESSGNKDEIISDDLPF